MPYAFDGTMVNNSDLLRILGGSQNIASYNNWAMINGFQFISGVSSIVFSVYDAQKLSKGYASDISVALDGTFVALNVLGGIVTANPFLLVAAVIKTSTILRKSRMGLGIETSGPFDLDVNYDLDINSMFGLEYGFDLNVERLFNNAKSFDFMYDDKRVSYDFV